MDVVEMAKLSLVQEWGLNTCMPKSENHRNCRKTGRRLTLYKLFMRWHCPALKIGIESVIWRRPKEFRFEYSFSENNRLVYHIQEETKKQNTPGLLLIVDFEKAFDILSCKFVTERLRPWFWAILDSVVQAFYFGRTASVLQKNHRSRSIPVARGCRQGVPIQW